MLTNDRYWVSPFRKLDVDDFFIMSCLSEGLFSTRIAEIMDTDLSGVRKRIKKIERAVPGTFKKVEYQVKYKNNTMKGQRHVLTAQGDMLARVCKTFLDALLPHASF